jgi:small subunit ribosomal protein S1
VIEADQRRDRLILSEKAAAQQLRRRRKEEASSHLEEGQALSVKRLEENPWARAARELAVGTDVDATVTRVLRYGAFARVTTGIEGLIHISEIAPRRIASPAEVVHTGDLVRVRVVAIDPERRRVSVSVR